MFISKYIIIDKVSISNKYRCNISKPYFISRYKHDILTYWRISIILVIGAILGVLANIMRNDLLAIKLSILLVIIFIFITALLYILEKNRKRKDIEVLKKSIISLGTIISIKSKVIAVLKLDGSDKTIEYVIEEPTTKINDRIAIIKTKKKPIILLKCTLVAVEE
ncbi:MAG: hypothetical protein FWE36_06425 [Erysipelotrichales bacterium]|nr:hypothetical protein [Erysipelotrichales bacterium]